MGQQSSLDHESSAVQKHIEITQDVITRMAENSRACKIWCVTLVAAVLVLVARTGEPQHALIALAPAVVLYVLDAYYLSLERAFRRSYNAFVSKVHSDQLSTTDLYAIAPTGSVVKGVFWAMFRSFSVLPFYLVVTATVLLAWCLVL